MNRQLWLWSSIFLLVLTAAPAVWAQKRLKEKESPQTIGDRDINKRQLNLFSPEKEMAMGKQMASEVEKRSKFIDDPVVLEFVNRITQNLALNSDTKTLMRVKVIDSSEINAFALPGGFLYVNRGLIEAADNEAELAGVIAHEVAHVAARHSMEQLSKGTLMDWVSYPLGFIGRWGNSVNQTAGLMMPALFLKFSRGAEEEADRLAAQYLWKSGYDPQALISFFEKLQSQEKTAPGTMRKLFRTHPMNEDRIKDTRKLLARFPKKEEYQISSADFIAVKERPVIKRYKWDEAAQAKKDRGLSSLKRRKRNQSKSPFPSL
ncbi:MAG TPA: M48 family metallopeptidase [Blastocatellia bacterium]|nr:M48 family metallopeptidase [Blastocatellia bacterium]